MNIGSKYNYGNYDQAEFLCVVSREEGVDDSPKTESTDKAKVFYYNLQIIPFSCLVALLEFFPFVILYFYTFEMILFLVMYSTVCNCNLLNSDHLRSA